MRAQPPNLDKAWMSKRTTIRVHHNSPQRKAYAPVRISERLLYPCAPIPLNPELACVIGLNEAIVVQQIHYWVVHNEQQGQNHEDGYYWTYQTIKYMQTQFPFWSERTIKRIINKLETDKILISGRYNKLDLDRTKWYRIDYENLDAKCVATFGGHENYRRGQVGTMQGDNVSPPIPETNPREIKTHARKRKPKGNPEVCSQEKASSQGWRCSNHAMAEGEARMLKDDVTAAYGPNAWAEDMQEHW